MSSNIVTTKGKKVYLSLVDRILLANYVYSMGGKYLEDREYDDLKQMLPSGHYLLYTLWSDILSSDNILKYRQLALDLGLISNECDHSSVKALSFSQYDSEENDISNTENSSLDYYDYIRSMFPTPPSIQMIDELNTVTDIYLPDVISVANNKSLGGSVDFLMSYKMDGWNITIYYDRRCVDENDMAFPVYAHTRGSDRADVQDCTRLMQLVLPRIPITSFNTGETILRFSGELVLTKEGLEVIRRDYPGKEFSNVRNTIRSFIFATIDIDKYYNLVHYFAFNVMSDTKGSGRFSKATQLYNWLIDLKFNVPPNVLLSLPVTVDTNYTKSLFLDTFQHVEDYYMNEFTKVFECDGVVFQPDDYSLCGEITPILTGYFSDGLIAIKAGYWKHRDYTSKVIKIYYPKSRVNRHVMALVESTVTKMGQIIKHVPLINLETALANDVRVGDTIKFQYHSNQLVFFLENLSQKERLKRK